MHPYKHQWPVKRGAAEPGDTVAFGRLDGIQTGETLSTEKDAAADIGAGETANPVFGLAIEATEKKDDVKLTAGLAKIIEEDPSLAITHNQAMGEMVLWGQGEIHLQVAAERLLLVWGVGHSRLCRPWTPERQL